MSDAQKFRLSHVIVTAGIAISLSMSTWVLYTTSQNKQDVAILEVEIDGIKGDLTEIKVDTKNIERILLEDRR